MKQTRHLSLVELGHVLGDATLIAPLRRLQREREEFVATVFAQLAEAKATPVQARDVLRAPDFVRQLADFDSRIEDALRAMVRTVPLLRGFDIAVWSQPPTHDDPMERHRLYVTLRGPQGPLRKLLRGDAARALATPDTDTKEP